MRVIAIIPAFNEEKTIGSVVDALFASQVINEVVVVSDGSTDRTPEIAKSRGATVIHLFENQGKGGALKAGLERSSADIVLFVDADLIGLTAQHVQALVEPVKADHADMTVGIFQGGRFATDLAQWVAPYLSGQRCVKAEALRGLSDMEVVRFGVEMALTTHTKKLNLRVMEVRLADVTHVTKEEKLGPLKGFAARLKMYWEIVKYLVDSAYREHLERMR